MKNRNASKKCYWYWAELVVAYIVTKDLNRKNYVGKFEKRLLVAYANNPHDAYKVFMNASKRANCGTKKTPLTRVNNKSIVSRSLGLSKFGVSLENISNCISDNYSPCEVYWSEGRSNIKKLKSTIPRQDKLLNDVVRFVKSHGHELQ